MLQSEQPYQSVVTRAKSVHLRRRWSLSLTLATGITLLLIAGIAYTSFTPLNEEFFHISIPQQDGYTQQFTTLQVTHNIDMYSVTLLKACADSNHVVLFYTVQDTHGKTLSVRDLLPSLSLADGTVLPWLYHAEYEVEPVIQGRSAFIFDAAALAAVRGPVHLRLRLKHALQPLSDSVVESAWSAPGKVVDFNFELPTHPARSLPVHGSATIGKSTLTLSRIELGDTGERLFVTIPHLEQGKPLETYRAQMQVAGRVFDAFPSRALNGEISYLLVDLARNREGHWLLALRPCLADSQDVIPQSPSWHIALNWRYS